VRIGQARESRLNARLDDLTERLINVERVNLALIDSTNALLRHTSQVGSRLTVVFLVSNISSFDTIREVISLMRSDERFQVIVASIHSRLTATQPFENEPQTHEYLVEQGIEHIRLPFDVPGLALLKQINPDIIVRQSQWDNDVQLHYSAQFLNFTHLVMIEYALGNPVDAPTVSPMYLHENYDSPLARMAWRVYKFLTIGVADKLREDFAPDPHNRVEVGSPLVASLLSAEPTWFRQTANQKIYWTAHHTIGSDWMKFGLLPAIYQDLLVLARNHPDTDFVLSEHPSLRGRIRYSDSPLSIQGFDRWLAEWTALPNTFEQTGADFAGYMKGADVVITDGLSPLIEAQIVGKPLIFLDRDGHSPFNAYGQRLATGFHVVPESPTMVQSAFDLAKKLMVSDPLKNDQEQNRELWTKYPDSARLIVEDMASLLAGRTDQSGQSPAPRY